MDHSRASEQASWCKAGGQRLSEELRNRILVVALERMALIDGKVYGLEDDAEPDRQIDCASRIGQCPAPVAALSLP